MSSGPARASPGESDRLARVGQIADECLQRWGRGEAISESDLIQANPDLLPELAVALQRIRRIVEAERRQGSDKVATTPSEETGDLGREHPASGCLHIRCPHCHNPVELLVDSPFTDITCRSCGSAFNLVGSDVHTRQAPPLQTLGHFELVSRLGIGGFGTVWKAHDIELDRTVAVKIPRSGQLDPIGEEQFLREARVAAQLRHPNIVCVHEVGREGDILYIVSDLVRGVSLTEWLTAKRPTTRETAALGVKIAHALHYAHEQGVVHRDLKPSNVMMNRQDEPHLLDFGLAKRDVGELTMTADGQILGTPTYMSPEQAEGEGHHVDRRSDIYSLGVILFELLTGELPFRGSAQMQIHQKLTDDPPSPRLLDRLVPRDLATICTKCMERDPNRRYSTARLVALDLERFLRGEPIQARPASRTERSLRWAKRNPALATAAALLVFLAIFGPILAWRFRMLNEMLDERLAERENIIRQFEKNKESDAGQIVELQRSLGLWEGRANPWLLWPPRPSTKPQRMLMAQIAQRESQFNSSGQRKSDEEQRAFEQLALAIMCDELQRSDDAVRHYQSACDSLEKLIERSSSTTQYEIALADCCRQLARLQLDANRQSATGNLEKGRSIIRRLAATSDDPRLQAGWLEAELESATAYGFVRGADSLRRAEQISDNFSNHLPDNPEDLYRLACFLGGREPILLTRDTNDQSQ